LSVASPWPRRDGDLSRRAWAAPLVLPMGCVVASVVPLFIGLNPFSAGLGALVGIWIIFAASYTVTYGFAGQFSVGHAALLGCGAYTTAILMTRLNWPFWPTMPAAIAVGAATGGIFMLPSWRLRGDYVALVTLAAGVIVQQVMLNWNQVTGGADGIANIPLVTLGRHVLSDNDYYTLILGLALLCTAFTSYLKHSPLGLGWRAVRDDELAAQASGMRTQRLKVLAFVVGGGLAGLAGSLFAVFNGFVSSVSFGLNQSVLVIVMVLIGGPGRVWSTAVVAALLEGLDAELTQFSSVSLGVTGILMLAAIGLGSDSGVAVARWFRGYVRPSRAPDPGPQAAEPVKPSGCPRGPQGRRVVTAEDPVLDVRDLRKHFDGVAAVHDVALAIYPGEVLAVIGHNGSGKTTLVNVVTGFCQPTCGSVRLRGRDIGGRPISEIARLGVGRTFQNLRLFEDLTSLENVMAGVLGRAATGFLSSVTPARGSTARSREQAMRTLELLGIGHRAQSRVKDLAHGDRRRVEIARALAASPALLILDEPSAGLTSAETDDLVGALRGLRDAHAAVLLIEHHLSVVERLADRVLVMHSGAPIAAGTLSEVLAEPTVRSLYMGLADV
jgi:branched-chain amino acid transport system ATP-binding protein/branched-chain amino acid transport system permease protein